MSEQLNCARIKLSKGRYRVGDTLIVFHPARPQGHQKTVGTWRDDATDEWLGYTLREAAALASMRFRNAQSRARGEGMPYIVRNGVVEFCAKLGKRPARTHYHRPKAY